MSAFNFFSIVLSIVAIQPTLAAPTPECMRFDEIYPTGKELCEYMWDGAFKYETNESNAYTMWFFDAKNPNDAIAKNLGKLNKSAHDICHLKYYHKEVPGPEPDNFTECHPWKDEACCTHETVLSAEKLKQAYGKEYHWDRCGELSPECERFFVQEACFYECDPNAGLYRKWHPNIYDSNNPDHNEWQMSNMPIKASYCDAWFAACRKDKFCASGGGSYFSCAAQYEKADAVKLAADLKLAQEKADAAENATKFATDAKKAAEDAMQQAELARAEAERAQKEAEEAKDDDGLGTAAIVGFITAAVIILALLCCSITLIMKEKAGKPVFGRLLNSQGPTGDGRVVGSSQF